MEVIKKIIAKSISERTEADYQYIANQIRKHSLEMVYTANSGHPGGPLGLADIYSVLYFKYLRYNVKQPFDTNRDRFILSNGHVCAVRYAVMALAGFMDTNELKTFRQLGSRLQGHPSIKYYPEVETSSGSLGQGLSIASGIALGLKAQGNSANVYVCISDGECQEGMTWEAAMAAAHYKSDNLIAFVDRNDIQIDGRTQDVMNLNDLSLKFESFGWSVLNADGHNIRQIDDSFQWAQQRNGKPKVIVFNTILGKGVDYMENNPKWHGSPPNKDLFEKAMQQLQAIDNEVVSKL